jgi:hypothetical protein
MAVLPKNLSAWCTSLLPMGNELTSSSADFPEIVIEFAGGQHSKRSTCFAQG